MSAKRKIFHFKKDLINSFKSQKIHVQRKFVNLKIDPVF